MGRNSNSTVSLILVGIAAVLAITAYVHGASDVSRGEMFTFAGGIVTGAFAFLNGQANQPPPPGSQLSTDTHTTLKTPPADTPLPKQ